MTIETAESPQSFDALRRALQARYEALSPHLQRLARFALDDPNAFALETVTRLATISEVQPSTLIRFAKEFGYSGFTEMQQIFKLRLIEGAPVYRERIYHHRTSLEAAAKDNPTAILAEFTEASIMCLERLRDTVQPDVLADAIAMMDEADTIYVIGQRRAFPIATYLAYGLTRLERRCHLIDFVGGMVPQQIATLRQSDLLIAIAFAEYTPAVVDAVRDVHIRDIPTFTLTDVPTSPLARHSDLYFCVDDADIHRFRPIAGSISLVQSLIIGLSYYQDADKTDPVSAPVD